MSVLIKGMNMPKDCYQCPMCFNDGGYACRLMNKPYAYLGYLHEGRRSDCPLVEIKTPHGRLIDEKDLFEQHPGKATHHHEYGFDWEIINAKEWLEKYVPTIIEAEG